VKGVGLGRVNTGFESHSRYGCVFACQCGVLSCAGRSFANEASPVQGVFEVFMIEEGNSDSEPAMRPDP
jgi:hypothetical protein